MKQAFGAALREAMGGQPNAALARYVGLTPDAVSRWVRGEVEPPPLTVFAVETFLRIAPGELSRHLGYVPEGAEQSVRAAIEADETLSAEAKRLLVATYRAGRRG